MVFRRLPPACRLGQNGLMDGRHGGVPGCLEFLEPAEEPRGVESGCADQPGAGRHGSERRSDQAMDMEERHHVQATVGGSQAQRGADVSRRGRYVAMGQGNPLGPGRRPRRMQDKGDVSLARQSLRSCRGPFRTVEEEFPGLAAGHRDKLDHRDSEPSCRIPRRRPHAAADHQGARIQVVQVEIEFGCRVIRVQGSKGGRRAEHQEGSRQFRPITQDNRDPIVAPIPRRFN